MFDFKSCLFNFNSFLFDFRSLLLDFRSFLFDFRSILANFGRYWSLLIDFMLLVVTFLTFSNAPECFNSTIFVSCLFSPWSKKILKIAFLKRTRISQFYYFCIMIIFTMVEENFENFLSETFPEWLNSTIFVSCIFSPWLKKILKIAFLKRPRMAEFYYFCHDYFHNG